MPRIPNWLFYSVIAVVLGLWVTGVILSWVSPNSFQMPESLNALAPVAVIAVLGSKAVSDGRKGDDDDEQ